MRKDEERGREGINHFVRKVRSIILISIDHRRTRTRTAAEDRKMTTVRVRRPAGVVCVHCVRGVRLVIPGEERFCETDAVPVPQFVPPSERDSARFHSALTNLAMRIRRPETDGPPTGQATFTQDKQWCGVTDAHTRLQSYPEIKRIPCRPRPE